MIVLKEEVDQRRWARFPVPSESAFTVFKRHRFRPSLMGNIVDIGLGGLSFRYIADEKCSSRLSHIDILSTDGRFSLNKVKVKTISDFEISNEASAGFETRQCGVQFGDLTDNQKSDLRYFIQTYTTADPES